MISPPTHTMSDESILRERQKCPLPTKRAFAMASIPRQETETPRLRMHRPAGMETMGHGGLVPKIAWVFVRGFRFRLFVFCFVFVLFRSSFGISFRLKFAPG